MFEITVFMKQAARLFLKSIILSSYYISLKVHLTPIFFFDRINYFIIVAFLRNFLDYRCPVKTKH